MRRGLALLGAASPPAGWILGSEAAGQLVLPGSSHPYGVILSGDFWEDLAEPKNRLIVPIDLLKLFIDRPIGWDYLCFLVARCGAARASSEVPHEALVSLFRGSEGERDRKIIERLRRYHREIMLATGGRLNAELVERPTVPTGGRGRPRKRWCLRIGPGRLFPAGAKIAGLCRSGFILTGTSRIR